MSLRDDIQHAYQAGGWATPGSARYARVVAGSPPTIEFDRAFFDERYLDGDETVDFDGVEVIVDNMSVPYLDGASIDFKDTISEQGFTIDNPNAAGSCACGDSFH